MQALASIITGRGGTVRMIVVGLVLLGVLDLAAEYNYQMEVTYKKDNSFSFRPAGTEQESEEVSDISVAKDTEYPGIVVNA